jgi:hypothetical protein
MDQVIRNGERTAGTIVGGSVQSYTGYAGTGMVGETVGWCAFTWFLVWLCIWRGIGMTGRVVYFVSGAPHYRITFGDLLTVVLASCRPWASQSSWSSS